MRHFVREHRRNGLACGDRGAVRVGKEVGFPIKNRGCVFHGARREVGHAKHVELAVWIFDREVAVVEPHDLLGRLERNAREVLLVGRRANADGHAVLRTLGTLKIADSHRHQIRRHLRRRRELQRVRCRRRSRRI